MASCICASSLSAQIGQSFELILEGLWRARATPSGRKIVSTSLTAMRIPLAAWWSRAFGLLGIWLALSVTAIFPVGLPWSLLESREVGAYRQGLAHDDCHAPY